MTNSELETYIRSIVTPQNFFVFAALANLKNVENYRAVIDLLYKNRLNLTDLTRLTLIDDIAISAMLADRNRLTTPTNIITTPTGATPAYTYLMGTDVLTTPLSVLMTEYNTYLTTKASSPEVAFKSIPVLYVDFADAKSKYSSLYEIQSALTSTISAINAAHPIPSFTPNASLSTAQKNFLNAIAARIFNGSSYTSLYRLLEIFVWNNDSTSLVSSKIQDFTLTMNLEKYKSSLETLLKNDVYSINTATTYNSTTIATLWTNFYNTAFTTIPIDDVMVYCLYTICKIRTIEQNNNLTVSNTFYNSFLTLYTYATTVSNFLQDSTLDLSNVLNLNSL
jgi:hypothetical protein